MRLLGTGIWMLLNGQESGFEWTYLYVHKQLPMGS